ncbi:hypothetical protein [Agrobacterium sp. 10MFCol1.1]|uniref:hypothetical protein n=1 Tax=Agrobacterium sp. 10MFCol1.1 TaxID=1150775 RepID=UPI000362DDC5|nr:hypothetical protein [Agrobacterium sp. 10MFCol1.1]
MAEKVTLGSDLAKRRLADEYDAAQERGEVKSIGAARSFHSLAAELSSQQFGCDSNQILRTFYQKSLELNSRIPKP